MRQDGLNAWTKSTRQTLDDLAAFRKLLGIPDPKPTIWQRIVDKLEDAQYEIRKSRAELQRMARWFRR